MRFPRGPEMRGKAKQDLGLSQHVSLVGREDGGTSFPQFGCTVNGDQMLRRAPVRLVCSFLWKRVRKKEEDLGDPGSKDSQGKKKKRHKLS